MSAEKLLERLDGVRRTGADKWRARCPAHAGRSLSLSIAEREGRTLVRCFAGCETEAVLGVVGLSFADLYDKPLGEHPPLRSAPWNAADVLDLALEEATVVGIVAADILEHGSVSEVDWLRLRLATGRLVELANVVNR